MQEEKKNEYTTMIFSRKWRKKEYIYEGGWSTYKTLTLVYKLEYTLAKPLLFTCGLCVNNCGVALHTLISHTIRYGN